MFIHLAATTGIPFPDIDPVMVSIGKLSIRWYAVSYVVGIFLGWWLIGKLDKNPPKKFAQKAYDDLIVWGILGILLGGRLGYVLFYNAGYYFSRPLEIIAVWNGGMSFHGGLIGVLISIYIMCRYYKKKFDSALSKEDAEKLKTKGYDRPMNYLSVMDMLAVVAPIGLFFGRLANFVNGELYGRETDVPWAVIFPGDPFARHPSQLYEAGLEGIILFLIMIFLFYKTALRSKPGALGGAFLAGYAVSRFLIEFVREPDEQIGFLFGTITMGQILCIPMFLIGLYLIFRKNKSVPISDDSRRNS